MAKKKGTGTLPEMAHTEGETQPRYPRCCVTVKGARCWFPATIYQGQVRSSSDSGECRLHYKQTGIFVIEAIEESKRWREAIEQELDVPLRYTLPDGTKVPGFPSEAQLLQVRSRRAMDALDRAGLSRREGETREDWRARCWDWVRGMIYGIGKKMPAHTGDG